MTLEKARRRLGDLQKAVTAYRHALGLLFYDGATPAPRGTAANRGRTTAVLSRELYRINTAPETLALLAFLEENRTALTAPEARALDLLRKESVKL